MLFTFLKIKIRIIQIVLGTLGCMNNENVEEKNSNRQHCPRCVYYLSDITVHTSILKNTVLVRIHRPSK